MNPPMCFSHPTALPSIILVLLILLGVLKGLQTIPNYWLLNVVHQIPQLYAVLVLLYLLNV